MTDADGVLVATSRQLLALSGDRVRVVHEGAGLYFGMTELDDRIYVACQHDTLAEPTPAQLDAQVGGLLVLDRELRVLEELRSSASPLRQPHGVAAVGGQIWVTGTYDDEIQIHDPLTGGWERWTPERGSGPPRPDHDDRFHYNAVREIYGGVQVLAHNYGRSQVLTFTHPGLELVSVTDLGVGAHDLFDHEGSVAVCSSLESALRAADGWVHRVGGFPRGIARVGPDTLIGFSEYAGRHDRHRTDGRLVRFDSRWQPIEEIDLPGCGQVLDLLALGRPVPTDLPERPASRRRGDSLRADEVTAYRVPLATPPLPYGEWHPGEVDQQFMAARHARLPILVNPGERSVTVEAVTYRVDGGRCRVLLDGALLGELVWSGPGTTTGTFRLPRSVRDRRSASPAELALEVDEIWQPDGDPRRIGVGLRTVSLA